MENDPTLRSADYARDTLENEKTERKGGKYYFEVINAGPPVSWEAPSDGPWVSLSLLENGQCPDGISYDPVSGTITWTIVRED